MVRGNAVEMDERGKPLPRRSNLWAVRLGYWHGRGYSARVIAEKLGEGTSEATVRGQIRKAGVLSDVPLRAVIPINVPHWWRDILSRHAEARGLSLDELICQVLESALILDDLYDAVTDGKYQGA